MSAYSLDNPIWGSLASRHGAIALGRVASALRYPAEIAPFLGVPGPHADVGAALDALVADDESVYLLGPVPAVPRTCPATGRSAPSAPTRTSTAAVTRAICWPGCRTTISSAGSRLSCMSARRTTGRSGCTSRTATTRARRLPSGGCAASRVPRRVERRAPTGRSIRPQAGSGPLAGFELIPLSLRRFGLISCVSRGGVMTDRLRARPACAASIRPQSGHARSGRRAMPVNDLSCRAHSIGTPGGVRVRQGLPASAARSIASSIQGDQA